MRTLTYLFVLLGFAMTLSGCGFLGGSKSRLAESDSYLEAKQGPKLVIPSEMRHNEIADIWIIPQIEERPLLKVFPRAAPRPTAIVGDADPDLVRIQSLGSRSWMVVQRTPETVWPVIKQYFQDNGVSVRFEDVADGVLLTEPLALDDLSEELKSVVNDAKSAESIVGGEDWIGVRLETGIRPGSAEVHVRFVNEEVAGESTEFPVVSSNAAVERKVLADLANYDASGYVAPTVSSEGRKISLIPKAEISSNDDGFPILRLRVDFERAWATISKALTNAELEVADASPENQYFEILISEDVISKGKRRGLFSNIFVLGGNKGDVRRVQVRVEQSEDAYDVVLYRGEDSDVSIEFAQQLLALLREYAV